MSTAPRVWLVPVVGLVLAPLVTWLPMLAHRMPGLGLPPYPPALGIDAWGEHVRWLVALGLVAALIATTDRWLAAAVSLCAATIFFRGIDPTHSMLFAVGALALWALRQTPRSFHRPITQILAGLGIFEAVYVWQQYFLQYDVLWGPLFGAVPNAIILPLGTLGTVDAASAYVAITAPLMPRWAWPIAIVAVWISQSLGALTALIVGLGVTILRAARETAWIRNAKDRVAALAVALVILGVTYAWFLTRVKTFDSVWPRVAVWAFGLMDALRVGPVFGYGLGGWSQRIPALQFQTKTSPTGELWREAHSEWVQWACELGVIGVCVLLGWLWTHRAMFVGSLGPSLAALAVSCSSFFTFHVVATALLGLVLIGLATAHETPSFAAGGA